MTIQAGFLQEINQFTEFVRTQDEIGIILGSHQNLDTVAAALSLFLSLKQAGKSVSIVSKKEPTVEISNLVGIDKIKKSFTGNTSKLVVALPYIKGEVEKVLFTEQQDKINFHLTAAAGRSITPFEIKDIELMWEGGAPSSIITVGVASLDEIADMIDSSSVKIVNVDNYHGNTRYGNIILVDDTASSLSEIVAKVLKDINLPVDIDIAQNILDGVNYSTRGFTKQDTSPLAFEAASFAMYQGAKRQDQRSGQQRQPQPQRQQRVADNDFPAMHFQQKPFDQAQGKRDNRQDQNQKRQFQQDDQTDRQQIIRNELANQPVRQAQDRPVQQQPSPRQEDPKFMNEDVNMPSNVQNSGDIPDDWLMPKVFKSSKTTD